MFTKTEKMLQLEALPENAVAGKDILFIIEKYYFQRLGEEYPSAVYYAEDEEFYEIQRQIWRKVIYPLKKRGSK